MHSFPLQKSRLRCIRMSIAIKYTSSTCLVHYIQKDYNINSFNNCYILLIFKFKYKYSPKQISVQIMDQEQICEMLKQIIPELQAKIREELKIEYDSKIKQIQRYYQNQIEKLIKNQQRLISEFQSKNDANNRCQKDIEELYSRISVLQSQRKNWCSIQIQYQSTIQELTSLLLTKNNIKCQPQSRQSLNISQNLKNEQFSSINAVHPPPKSTYIEQRLYIAGRKQKQSIQPKQQSQKMTKFSQQYININQQSGIISNSLTKYIKQSHNNTVSDQQSCDHYHSVLSPPKQQPSTKTKRLFWDDNKKKQLLSLIKLH